MWQELHQVSALPHLLPGLHHAHLFGGKVQERNHVRGDHESKVILQVARVL